jgi:hypothetical protein
VQVKDVLVKLRSEGITVNVAKYKKVGWLQHGQTLVGLMRVFIVMAQEGFQIHKTDYLGKERVLFCVLNSTGSKLDPMYRYCKGGNGCSDCIQTKNFFIRVMIRFFHIGLRTGPDKSGKPGS